jgi:hypothetical protein
MIRRIDVVVRTELAAAPLDRSLALFEAAMMARCAALPRHNPCRPRGGAHLEVVGEPRVDGGLIEFTSAAAARRYQLAVAALTPDVTVRERRLGGRHQYEVHEVSVPPRLEPMVANRLRRAWQAGADVLADQRPMHAMKRLALARSAWRAALLVVGPGRGVGCVRLRLGDRRAMEVLLISAAELGLSAQAQRRPGGYLVTVEGGAAVQQLLDAAGCVTEIPLLVPTSA